MCAFCKLFIAVLVIFGPPVEGHAALFSKGPAKSNRSAAGQSYETTQPLLDRYCYNCHGNGKHKGDLVLDRYHSSQEALADHDTWQKVLEKIRSQEMPPENKPQPTAYEREQIIQWIDTQVLRCDPNRPDPGRVTIRRLNRAEYNNTIRDLLGVQFRPADDFPADDSGYGFDNIADALSMPPILIERYLAAAERILDSALLPAVPPMLITRKFAVDALEVGYNAKRLGNGWVTLNSIEEDDVAFFQTLNSTGSVTLRAHAFARADTNVTMNLSFKMDDQVIKTVAVKSKEDSPAWYEAKVDAPAAKHRFSAVVLRTKDGLSPEDAAKWKEGKEQKGSVSIDQLEFIGPPEKTPAAVVETDRKLFGAPPKPGRELAAARDILGRFAKRAYRRPLREQEVVRLLQLARNSWEKGETFRDGVRVALKAVLVSPNFLFRGEWPTDAKPGTSPRLINEYALASRLSYFLWSSMPDDELFAQAERGTLRKNLERQVKRMLKDPRANALVDNFAGQWLQIRNLDLVSPDPELFPEFDEPLKKAMRRETELFFETIMREDRSVLEFIDADYTFVNDLLAQHYGLSGVAGGEFRKVSLRSTPRRGVLTQGSVLTITSNPTRTSPVKRGKWVLENILNTPPPPPPPDVPELKEGRELTGTLRQRMEQHREDPTCASCHARMDPIGFGLENFNAVGGWRLKDGDAAIDASGKLVSGESFNGASDLAKVLMQRKREEFVRALATKMLIYGLGRGLEYYDKCAVDQVAHNLATKQYRFSALILEVAKGVPFQMQRGDATQIAAR